MADFKTFVDQAWRDHGDDPRGTADRLADALPLIRAEPQIADLAALAHHVYGEHLGAWREGLAFFDRIPGLPTYAMEGTSGQALRRCIASLTLASGIDDLRPGLSRSDRIRVGAMAASNLVERDVARAATLFEDALEQARSTDLAADDPANRTLAVTGNSLACALEQTVERDPKERELMIVAAQAARQYWEVAGTWLETERAEYRLAMTWLQAGDPAQARHHAEACLAIVDANNGAALEWFFGHEAAALAEHALGNTAARAEAVAAARRAFEQLDAGDKSWCAETLTKLTALAPT